MASRKVIAIRFGVRLRCVVWQAMRCLEKLIFPALFLGVFRCAVCGVAGDVVSGLP